MKEESRCLVLVLMLGWGCVVCVVLCFCVLCFGHELGDTR